MKNPSKRILMLLLPVFLALEIQAQQAAFPGAEGHGMYTTGGRGGRVIKVTNLNDSGEGSLRAAIEAEGPRIVVFEVSGNIELKSRLVIQNGYLTIAGQTAPGDGICIKGYEVYLDGCDEVIIRYVRFRMGDEARMANDAFGGQGGRNIIIDHCSMSWSIDECASFYANENFTMQWCLLTESLRNSYHYGSHGFGGIWGGNRASFHHNLLTHHSNRNPRFRGHKRNSPVEAEWVDLRNNVIYNYAGTCYGSEGGGSYNMVNNYYKAGPASGNMNKELLHVNAATAEYNWLELEGAHGVFYVRGNYIAANETYSNDNWRGVEWDVQTNIDRVKSEVEFEKGNIRTEDVKVAYTKVLEYAGASLSRDAVDKRAIHDSRTGTATVMDGGNGSTNGYIDTQEAVGGWPVLNSLPAPLDTDGDGMPDDWELARGLDPDDPTDGNGDRDRDLYTNIEEYINSLALGYFDTDPFIHAVKPRENEIFIAEGGASVQIEAYSNDYNGGSVVKMELYLDDELVLENSDSAKILTTLENVLPGMHHVTVKSTDNSGRVTVDQTTVYVGSEEVGITVEETPHGRVALDPPGGIYTGGVKVSTTAVPDEGYLFHGWIKDIESTRNNLLIKTVKDVTIKPVFVKDSEKKSIWTHPVKINFQPEEDYPIPDGYLADFGGAYCDKWTGYTYGWIEGYNPSHGFNSNEYGAWETYRYFENDTIQYSWGMELPRGRYKIILGLGGKLQGTGMTGLKINVEGIEVEDDDGIDLLDEHILDSIPVLDGQLKLTSVEQSRICFIEVELLELVSPSELTVDNGRGGGAYYPDLGEESMVVAEMPPAGQVFDKWTGDTTYLEDVFSSTTFITMADTNIHISATYKNMVQDTAYFLIIVDGAGSGYYSAGTEVEISVPDTLGGGYFSHWEYDCLKPVAFDGGNNRLMVTMPDANIVFEPVYKVLPQGKGDVYQAEEAIRDKTSTVERYYKGYYGTGYVNFREDQGAYVQFNNVDGKDGGKFTIKLRYSLNDTSREGAVIVNGIRYTFVMTGTNSWSEWNEVAVSGTLVPGPINTIYIETTGGDLGYLDQIETVKASISKAENKSVGHPMSASFYPNPFKEYAIKN